MSAVAKQKEPTKGLLDYIIVLIPKEAEKKNADNLLPPGVFNGNVELNGYALILNGNGLRAYLVGVIARDFHFACVAYNGPVAAVVGNKKRKTAYVESFFIRISELRRGGFKGDISLCINLKLAESVNC